MKRRDDRRVHDVGRAQVAEQERPAAAEARPRLRPELEDADDLVADLVGQRL